MMPRVVCSTAHCVGTSCARATDLGCRRQKVILYAANMYIGRTFHTNATPSLQRAPIETGREWVGNVDLASWRVASKQKEPLPVLGYISDVYESDLSVWLGLLSQSLHISARIVPRSGHDLLPDPI
jgi:hypothetical protein